MPEHDDLPRPSPDRKGAYYSTDAIVSRARALSTLVRAERVTGERLVTRDSTAVLDLQGAADEIVRRQQPGGQIAFWPGARRSKLLHSGHRLCEPHRA